MKNKTTNNTHQTTFFESGETGRSKVSSHLFFPALSLFYNHETKTSRDMSVS